MRVLVTGSVKWEDAEAIRRELAALPEGAVVLHGDAPGADALAGRLAREEFGVAVERWEKGREDYRRYRRGAWKGLNERMLASGPDLVLAFHPCIEESKGTRHLVELAREAGVPVRLVTG